MNELEKIEYYTNTENIKNIADLNILQGMLFKNPRFEKEVRINTNVMEKEYIWYPEFEEEWCKVNAEILKTAAFIGFTSIQDWIDNTAHRGDLNLRSRKFMHPYMAIGTLLSITYLYLEKILDNEIRENNNERIKKGYLYTLDKNRDARETLLLTAYENDIKPKDIYNINSQEDYLNIKDKLILIFAPLNINIEILLQDSYNLNPF